MSRPCFQPFIKGSDQQPSGSAHGAHEKSTRYESTEALLGLRHASLDAAMPLFDFFWNA
jgi:hypothetical protein